MCNHVCTECTHTQHTHIHDQQVTYADFAVAVLLHTLDTRRPGILDPLPRLTTLRASVEKLPSIEAWMKKRPETPY